MARSGRVFVATAPTAHSQTAACLMPHCEPQMMLVAVQMVRSLAHAVLSLCGRVRLPCGSSDELPPLPCRAGRRA